MKRQFHFKKNPHLNTKKDKAIEYFVRLTMNDDKERSFNVIVEGFMINLSFHYTGLPLIALFH